VGFDAPEASNNLCYNVAINIKYRAVGHPVLKAQETPDAVAGVTEKTALYASA
jgi:putative transposase